MYKKILFILSVVFGIFVINGCHKDSEEIKRECKTINWGYDESYEAIIIQIEKGKAYFRISDSDYKKYDAYNNNSWEGYVLVAPGKWFYTKEWPRKLEVGDMLIFRVEKAEYYVYDDIGIPEPADVHFFIVPVDK